MEAKIYLAPGKGHGDECCMCFKKLYNLFDKAEDEGFTFNSCIQRLWRPEVKIPTFFYPAVLLDSTYSLIRALYFCRTCTTKHIYKYYPAVIKSNNINFMLYCIDSIFSANMNQQLSLNQWEKNLGTVVKQLLVALHAEQIIKMLENGDYFTTQ